MKWISRTHKTNGVEWKEEGWFFDNPTMDYSARLLCKKCGNTLRIDECGKKGVAGYNGDSCGAAVFYLYCGQCWGTLATIDEGSGEFRPLLKLENDSEFVVENETLTKA